MPEVALCPEDVTFRQVLLGDASTEVELQVARHFVGCEKCASRARNALANEQTKKAVRKRGENRPLWQFYVDASKLSAQAATVSRVEAMEATQQFQKISPPTSTKETPFAKANDESPPTQELAASVYAFLAPPESKEEIGRLGGYSVTKLLGAGGMGMVFQAEDPHLQRKVALKVMRPEVAAVNNAKARFLREARTMALIEHDHVVAVFQVGEDRGVPFMAMPFLLGMPLDVVLKKNRNIPLVLALRMGYQIAIGLASAHAKGLIHRDIKPANIWIETQNNNRVKLLDFGLARGDKEDIQLTQSGSILGTPAYMAPEQAAGGAIDARADLFSLGVVLYELTTGRRPFCGANTMAILTALAIHTPPAPHEIASSVPESVSALIMRLLEKDPERRVGSAQEAAKELAALLKTKAAPAAAQSEEKLAAETAILSPSVPTIRAVARHKELAPPPAQTSNYGGRKGRLWAMIGGGALGAAALILAVVTIFFQTPYGTLEVQIDDPKIEARFKNGALILADETGKTRYTLRPAAELADKNEKIKAGDYQLRVEGADGLTVDTENFTLRDGKREIVKVILRPAATPTPASTVSSSPPTDFTPAVAAWEGWSTEGPKPAIAPFSPTQARAHQEAWATHLKIPVEYTNSLDMKFVLIPPGEFLCGASEKEIEDHMAMKPNPHWKDNIPSTGPQHRVVLTQPFYLAVTEVTQKHYQAVTGSNPAHFSESGAGYRSIPGESPADYPVDSVSWLDATQFANQLSQREQMPESYARGDGSVRRVRNSGYRLPNEAEWEFACRGGAATRFYCGEEIHLNDDGWTVGYSDRRPHRVGKLKPNPFGLHDVIGNLWEWVEDSWGVDDHTKSAAKLLVDPEPEFTHAFKVNRGGAYDAPPLACSSATRDRRPEDIRDRNLGLRIALSVEAVKKKLGLPDSTPVSPASPTIKPAESAWNGWPTDSPKPAISPFGGAEARAYQEAWAAHLKLPVEWTNSLGMKFVLIPPGENVQGATPAEIEFFLFPGSKINDHWRDNIRSSGPQHTVVLTQPYYLCATEVTQEQYRTVTGVNPSQFFPTGSDRNAIPNEPTKNFPVDSVDWPDATQFANQLSQREKLQPCYSTVNNIITRVKNEGYRLPTEAEWEFAARSGTTTRFYSGDSTSIARFGWTLAEGRRPHPVGSLKPNAFGLHDVMGNLWEWVEDSWELDDYQKYTSAPAVDPAPAFTHIEKLNRGGAIDAPAEYSGSAVRERRNQSSRHANMSLRLALPVAAVRQKIASPTPPAVLVDVAFVKSNPGEWKKWPAGAPNPAIAPFTPEQAKQHQKAWAEHLKLPVEYTNSIGMKFVLIPPGEYLRGSTPEEIYQLLNASDRPPDHVWRDCFISSSPQHHTVITRPFYLGVFEVAQEQYEAVMGANPSHFSKTGAGAIAISGETTANLPAESMTWLEAADFANRLSQREKLEGSYGLSKAQPERTPGAGYRLPTEAEWEMACRAGTTTPYYSGDIHTVPGNAWVVENSNARTHPVGNFSANPYGLHDMMGNVFEWTEDAWEFAGYTRFSSAPAVDPEPNFTHDLRTGRGGAFNSPATLTKSAVRGRRPQNTSSPDVGFRLLLSVEAVQYGLATPSSATNAAQPPP